MHKYLEIKEHQPLSVRVGSLELNESEIELEKIG